MENLQELQEQLKKLYAEDQRIKKETEAHQREKKKTEELVRNYLQCANGNEVSFFYGQKRICYNEVKRQRLIWDLKKLEKKLGLKSTKIIKKVVKIKGKKIDRFFNYLKTLGAKWNDVLLFIETDRTIDEDQLEQMLNLGMIKKREIEGCYEIAETTSYFRFFE